VKEHATDVELGEILCSVTNGGKFFHKKSFVGTVEAEFDLCAV
jgi:hypothetical protein